MTPLAGPGPELIRPRSMAWCRTSPASPSRRPCTRARAGAGGEARVERKGRSDRSRSRSSRSTSALADSNRYPDVRLLPAPRGSRGASRRRLRGDDGRGGADAVIGYVCQSTLIPVTRCRALAVVPELRARSLEARRGPGREPCSTRARRRRRAPPGVAARRSRLPPDREQPDGDDDLARDVLRFVEECPRTSADRGRRGLLRGEADDLSFPDAIEDAAKVKVATSSPADLLEDLRPGGPPTATAPARSGDRGDPQGAARLRRTHARRRGLASL